MNGRFGRMGQAAKVELRGAALKNACALAALCMMLALCCAVLAGCSMQTTADGGQPAKDASAAATAATSEDSVVQAEGQDAAAEAGGTGASSGSSAVGGGGQGDSATEGDGGAGEAPASQISVSVYVDSSNAAPYGYGSCLFSGTVQLSEGATPFDALRATGLSYGGNRSYVNAISGLAEKSCDHASSGWKYFVNGYCPGSSCGAYTLHDGDSLRWKFVFDINEQ